MFIDNLRQLIPGCDQEQDQSVPIWDADECVRTTTTIAGMGVVDCASIQSCMQPTIDGLDVRISNNRNSIDNLIPRITVLENYPHHDHANKTILDNIVNSGPSTRYLGQDGVYHDIPATYFYQHVRSNGNYVVERPTLNFSSIFSVTDDPANERTNIGIDPAYLGGGTSPGTDDYVISGSFNNTNNVITLVRALGGSVLVPLVGLQTSDELVKVGNAGTPGYLNENDFENNGVDIEVKKQMSIVSDAAGLKLDGDEQTPGANMLYGTDGVGNKGRVANTSTGQLSYNAVLQNTVTAPHNLGKFPKVLCINNSGQEVFPGEVTYSDNNNLSVSFSPAFTGDVYLV